MYHLLIIFKQFVACYLYMLHCLKIASIPLTDNLQVAYRFLPSYSVPPADIFKLSSCSASLGDYIQVVPGLLVAWL
jgi:hypothetical protein